MKKSLIILLLLSSFYTLHAQDYMEEIASQTCTCMTELPENLEEEERNMKLGLCMISAAMPYKKKIKKDHKIDLDRLGDGNGDAEKLGQMIGIKMVTVCPDAFLKFTQQITNEATEKAIQEESTTLSEKTTTGEITDINNDLFVVFSIKETSGKTTKYYWLTFIESDLDLPTSYKMLLGKNTTINYSETEYFDPKIKEYKMIRIIKSIQVN